MFPSVRPQPRRLSTTPGTAGPEAVRLPTVRRVRLIPRRGDDDADVIRARLRALLDEGAARRGWVPEDDPDQEPGPQPAQWGAETDTEVPVRSWQVSPWDLSGDREGIGLPDPARGEVPAGIGRHRAPGPAVRLDPGRRGAWALWLVGLLGALALVAWTWMDRPQVHPVPAAPHGAASLSSAPRTPPVGEAARTSSTVVVSVVGQVARPGLVTLPSGARVADAVQAAGGLLPGTDPAVVNLAAVVSDGQQIAVAVPGAAPVGQASSGSAAPVDINTATSGDLDALPGIGPVLAQRIVAYRQEHGPFRTAEQLADVPGIGPALCARLAPLVRT